MVFNPDEFASNLYSTGVAKTSNFVVNIFPPSKIEIRPDLSKAESPEDFLKANLSTKALNKSSMQSLSLRIEACDIPGQSSAVTESFTYGVPSKVGLRTSYTDVNMTIILSEDMRERNLLESWIRLTSGGARPQNYKNQTGSVVPSFDIGYPDDYYGQVKIAQIRPIDMSSRGMFGALGKYLPEVPGLSTAKRLFASDLLSQRPDQYEEAISWRLFEAFPTMIMPLQATWGDETYHKLQVTFTYRYYQTTESNITNQSSIAHGNMWNTSGIGAGAGVIAGQTLGKGAMYGEGAIGGIARVLGG